MDPIQSIVKSVKSYWIHLLSNEQCVYRLIPAIFDSFKNMTSNRFTFHGKLTTSGGQCHFADNNKFVIGKCKISSTTTRMMDRVHICIHLEASCVANRADKVVYSKKQPPDSPLKVGGSQ